MSRSTLFSIVLFFGPVAMAQSQSPLPPHAIDYGTQGAKVVQELTTKQFASVVARFDSYMRQHLPEKELGTTWQTFTEHTGAFEKVTSTQVTTELGGYQSVAMSCAFGQSPEENVLVTFDKEGQIVGLYFGPESTEVVKGWSAPGYAAIDRFHELPVMVEDGPWHLPGTLTLPNGQGPFPVVVLVPGSPPLDQDATMGPNKMFKDIAWGLASRGIAVLRYTKRTDQYGTGLGAGTSEFNVREELVDDAKVAVALVAKRPEIDSRHIYLIGHSMGGALAPMIVSGNPSIAGVAIMGGPAQPLAQLFLERLKRDAAQGGSMSEQLGQAIPVFEKLSNGTSVPGATGELVGVQMTAQYWVDLRDYDPGLAAAKLGVPLLVMLAGHDAEVPKSNLEGWKSLLKDRVDASVRFYPNLFHLFLPSSATGDSLETDEDWERPGHVSAEVVNDLATWVASGGKKLSAK